VSSLPSLKRTLRFDALFHACNELTFELLDALALPPTPPFLGGEGLEQGLGASVVDLDLVRLRSFRHHHGNAVPPLIGMDARHTCCEDQ